MTVELKRLDFDAEIDRADADLARTLAVGASDLPTLVGRTGIVWSAGSNTARVNVTTASPTLTTTA